MRRRYVSRDINFLDIIHVLFFKLKTFRNWILSPSLGKTSTQLVQVDRAEDKDYVLWLDPTE
jgi:hypothetical protein